MQTIIATNCDLRLARIIAMLCSRAQRIELTYLPDDETYMLYVDRLVYMMVAGSDDDEFIFDCRNGDTHPPISFSMPDFMTD